MSKAVLISINPKWCAMIASGEKTVEIRKNRPQIKPPFKCYIYCTKHNNDKLSHWSGKVIGEFVCDTYIKDLTCGHDPLTNGAACIPEEQAAKYANGKPIYGWHISDLKIYDTPKELVEFTPFCRYIVDDGECDIRIECDYQRIDYNPDGRVNVCRCGKKLSKAPQSWCYVDD